MRDFAIGILKEEDGRVIIVPEDLQKISQNKNLRILVEENIGQDIGYTNQDFVNAGATIKSKEDIWKCATLLFKYKAPRQNDFKYFREGLTLCGLLHPEGNSELIDNLNKNKMTSISLEYIKDQGFFPLGAPGGQIAGKVSVMYANLGMQSINNGLGKLLYDVTGAPKVRALVIGHGHVGSSVIHELLKSNCDITVYGRNEISFNKSFLNYRNNIRYVNNKKELLNYMHEFDIVFGAILISTNKTPPILTKEHMNKMRKGTVIIDITCGYGKGYLPLLVEKTDFITPFRLTETGQVYCKIDNLPSVYQNTSSHAYSSHIIKYIPRIIRYIHENNNDSVISNGKITENGNIVHKGVEKDLSEC